MPSDGALDLFHAESDELLDAMESALLRMEDGEYDLEILNEIFRSAHTIKGSAGIFGLDHIVAFTHVVENVLDRARDNEILIESELLDVIFKCRDHIAALVRVSLDEFEGDEALEQQGEHLLKDLEPWVNGGGGEKPAPSNDESGSSGSKSETVNWHLSLRLSPDVLQNGMDPLSFITFLGTLGRVHHIETLQDNLPAFEDFDPEKLHLAYEIALETDADLETIEDVFSLVQEGSLIRILPPKSKVEHFVKLINELPESNKRLGEILVRCGAVTKKMLRAALDTQMKEQVEHGQARQLGQVLNEDKGVSKQVVDAAVERQRADTTRKSAGASPQLIRVDAGRLDNLINLIGELVISRQRVDLLVTDTQNDTLIEAVNNLGGFTELLRDAALNLRMVPIGATFQKFKRIVRDTAQELGKNIQLIIEGAETEMDRLMVEKLGDPLTHIVRNAMDHGIESIEARVAAGKPEMGTLKLAAYHDAGHVVIEISDDGGGIVPERIRAKAVEKGVIEEDAVLSDQEILQLVFHPGFSTAESVTNLSGRGVGMDVVKRNVESLQGHIDIQSVVGTGTTFTIRLPLTLAIIDGFHVASGGTDFIIPQAAIIECTNLNAHLDTEERHCINLRGDMIPYLKLSEIFNLPEQDDTATNSDKHIPAERKDNLLVVQVGGERAGIVVEHLHGELQTVVKPLGPIFKPLKGIGGSSLLGSGDIAFIVDIAQLIETVIMAEAKEI